MLRGTEKLTNEQQKLVNQIIQRSPQNTQARADEIVLAMEICKKESRQAKVDEIVEKTKMAMEIYKSEGQQAKVDKMIAVANA